MTVKRSAILRGRKWEKRLVEWLRDRDFEVEHNKLVGADDEGDVAIRLPEFHVLAECKSPGKNQPLRITEWLREAETEVNHYAAARRLEPSGVVPVVVIERVGEPIEEAWVVVRLKEFIGGA